MTVKTDLSFLNKLLGSAFLIGYSKYFPGTFSSLLLVPFYSFIKDTSLVFFIIIVIALIAYSFYAVPLFEKQYGKDPACYTIDEVAATYILLYIIALNNFNLITGFILWRLIDIFKPFYINRLQKLKSTYGVMLDDIAAIGITLILLWLLKSIV